MMKRSMIKAFTLAQIGAIFAFCFAKLLSCIYKNSDNFLAIIMCDAKHSIGARDLAQWLDLDQVLINIKIFYLAF